MKRWVPGGVLAALLFISMMSAMSVMSGCSLFRSEPASLPPTADLGQLTVFQDINLFAGALTTSVAHQDIWVQNGMIAHVGATGEKSIPEGSRVVPGDGMTLLPGLIDLHVHTSGDASPPWDLSLPNPDFNMQAYLKAGITTVADMGGGLGDVSERREKVRSGTLVGPNVLMAGPHFTAHDGHPVAMMRAFVPWPISLFVEGQFGVQVDTTAEVDAYFPTYLSYHPDIVKLTSDQIPLGIPTLSLEVARYIVEKTHASGRKAFAHIGANADARKMAMAGVDVFVHNVYRDRLTDEVAELIALQGIQVAPTLAVFDASDRLAAGDLQLSPLDRVLGSAATLVALDEGPGNYKTPHEFNDWLRALHENRQVKFENVATLRRHGVTLLVGSDSPSLGHFAGAGLHKEMELLAQAGLAPGEVLKAVTHDNAIALGLGKEVGAVVAGKRADLLLVKGDPSLSIANIHNVRAVFMAGKEVSGPLP